MIDGPSEIDPLVAEGPRAPVETLRPGLSLERVLLLDEGRPLMADLATGDIRPYESGPPVSVPMWSDHFDLSTIGRLQVQVTRDPRPASVSQTLLAVDVSSAQSAVDVRLTPSNVLEICGSGKAQDHRLELPAGGSPAFVIAVDSADETVTVSVRNAETLDFTSVSFDAADTSRTVVTVGGPSQRSGSASGRRRSVPVLIEIHPARVPVDHFRRALRGARRIGGALRQRVS